MMVSPRRTAADFEGSYQRAECPGAPGGIGEELAGYKGYGYATVVEILSAALQGGSFLKMLMGLDENGQKQPYHLGHFFLVIHPEFFMGEAVFRKTAGTFSGNCALLRRLRGRERIYTAGEKEYLVWQERKEKGVPVGEAVQREFLEIRDRYHLPYRFPFEKQ